MTRSATRTWPETSASANPGIRSSPQNGDQFQCTRRNDTTDCRRPGYFNQTLNKCVCSDRNITYDRNSNNPCGPSFDAGFGVTAQQLQQACTNVGQWNNGFCACTSGQQFNYFTTRCEPVSYYHTRDICRNGATYYGANQGVCVCQNSQALVSSQFRRLHYLYGYESNRRDVY